jgi:hypothetical protein
MKYKVDVACTIELEAESEDEAEALALQYFDEPVMSVIDIEAADEDDE